MSTDSIKLSADSRSVLAIVVNSGSHEMGHSPYGLRRIKCRVIGTIVSNGHGNGWLRFGATVSHGESMICSGGKRYMEGMGGAKKGVTQMERG